MRGVDRKAIHALIEGRLAEPAARRLRARLAADPALESYRARMEATRAALGLLRERPALPAMPAAPEHVGARVPWRPIMVAAAAALAAVAWLSLRGPSAPQAPTERAVALTLVAPEASEVQVAGDFSGWRPVPLARVGARWRAELRLRPGRYAYMFLVDGRWTPDPEAHSVRDDEFGRQNAVLHL